jgi:hypothetical protein
MNATLMPQNSRDDQKNHFSTRFAAKKQNKGYYAVLSICRRVFQATGVTAVAMTGTDRRAKGEAG